MYCLYFICTLLMTTSGRGIISFKNEGPLWVDPHYYFSLYVEFNKKRPHRIKFKLP